jgi:hypothetical protein
MVELLKNFYLILKVEGAVCPQIVISYKANKTICREYISVARLSAWQVEFVLNGLIS